MTKKRDEIVLDALNAIDDMIPPVVDQAQLPLLPVDDIAQDDPALPPPAGDDTLIDFLLPPPTLSVKIERNSKGYNYEVSINGARTIEELRDSLRNARQVVIDELNELSEPQKPS